MKDKLKIYESYFSVKGKNIIIIGATGLLGSQFSNFLSSLGANIIISDVDEQKCIQAADNLRDEYQTDPLAVRADITNEEDILNLFSLTIGKYGKIDVLINNAQIKPERFYASFENQDKETIMQVLDGNLGAVILCCREACKQFLKQGHGNIINISSTYGNVGADQRLYDGVKNIYFSNEKFSSPVTYAVTKAGILNLTRYLASYYREKNIRVNTLSPGGVFDKHDDVFVKNYAVRTLLGRMAEKNEYNAAILFLASDASSYMTGANLIIDGGWTSI